ncbi:MAG: hypothetical protein JNM12_14965 [Alphaproteobacteria bacterium]|nr:hypothetical protein [Alphaproteobacteria bacterium]
MLKFLEKYFTKFYLSKWPIRFVGWCVLGLIAAFFFGPSIYYSEQVENARLTATISQISHIQNSFEKFKETYHGIPGDIAGLGDNTPACKENPLCASVSPTAGDGIVGRKDFLADLKTPLTTQLPAQTADDEATLFWTQLQLADLHDDKLFKPDWLDLNQLKTAAPLGTDLTTPKARIGGRFVAGYADNIALPPHLSPHATPMKGHVILLMSEAALQGKATLTDDGEQALSAFRAVQMDRKMDDGKPNKGYVQAYGSPECFRVVDKATGYVEYNEKTKSPECGLVIRIAD